MKPIKSPSKPDKNQLFSELEDVITKHLKYISGPANVNNQGVQATDFDQINLIKDLELHNMYLVNKVVELEQEKQDLINIIHSHECKNNLEIRANEKLYLEQIDELKKKNKILIDELMHVKMILRSPFLYDKY